MFPRVIIFVVSLLGSLGASADVLLNQVFTTNLLPPGWTNNALQGAAVWQIQNAPALGSTSGTFYAVFNDEALGAGTFPNEAALTTPAINASNRYNLRLKYQHHWYGVEDTHGFVEVSTNGGATWTTVFDYHKLTRGSLAAPQDTTLNISAIADNQANLRIRFRYTDGGMAGKYWYLDDIIVYSEPDVGITQLIAPAYLGCAQTYNAAQSVTVQITNFGINPVTNIPVVCNVTGGTTATLVGTYAGTINGGATATYTLPGTINMSADAVYNFEIYSTLATDSYLFNDTLYDSRQQLVVTYPYLMNFNGTMGGYYATGQSPPGNNGRNFYHSPIPYLNGPQGEGDSWYVETTTTNDGTYIWVETPVFNFTGLTNPKLSFDIKYSLHSSDYFHVEYSTNGGTTWTQLGTSVTPGWYNNTNWWQNNYTAPVDQWTRVQHSLCALAGQSCVKFRIYGRPYYSYPTYPSYYNFAFDNLEIRDGPDVGITAFIDPVNVGCLFNTNQQVTVTVYNYGCNSVTNIPVTCEITGAYTGTLSGTVPGPLAAGTAVNYTFPGTFDMTPTGIYDFMAYTAMTGDLTLANDTLTTSINVNQLKVTTYPYTEDFNSGSAYWIASGQNPPLNNGRNFVLGALPYLNGPQGMGDSWYVETTSSNDGTYIWVESPVFDFSAITNPKMTFDVKYSLHSSDYFQVTYSLNGGVTWTQLGSGPSPTWYNNTNWWQNNYSTPVDQWTTMEQDLCALSGEPCVKFRIYGRPYYSAPTYPTYYQFAFDNFSIDAGEPDDIEPRQITLNGSGVCGNYTAAETIAALIHNNTCRPLYNVPIDLQIDGGAVIAEIMPGPIPAFGNYIYTFSATANLSAPGTHTISVTTQLATDNVTWNDNHTETRITGSAPILAYPYAQDFNSGNGGWVSRTTDATRLFALDTLPYLNGPQGEGESWYVETVTTNNGSNIWVESPVFNLSGLTNPQLSFDIKYSLHSSDYFHVEYSTNGGTTWTQLGTGAEPNWYNSTNWWQNNYTTPVDQWTRVQHSLCAVAGQTCVKFRMYGRPYYSYPTYPTYYNFAFDNVEVKNGPDVGVTAYVEPVDMGCLFATDQEVTITVYNFGCQPVSNVPVACDITGPSSGTLTGTVPGPIPGGGSVNYTFPSTFNMTTIGIYNFNSYTSYPGDINTWNDDLAATINVNQLKVTTYPYTEDFNSGPAYWIASGQNPPLNNGRNFVLGALPYLNGPQGMGDSWYVETTSTNDGTYIWVESPVFDFSSITNPKMTFDIKYSLHSSDYFQVTYSLNGGVTWTQLGSGPSPTWYNNTNWWQNNYSTPVDQWTTMEQDLCALSGEPCVKFRIYGRPYYSAPTYPTYYQFAFDNFSIDAGEPDDIEPRQITLNSSGVCGNYTNSETIAALIHNNTCRPLYSVPIDLQIDGGAVITEIMPGPIPAFGNYIYTFSATANLSAPGTHTISVTTQLATDNVTWNDNHTETRITGSTPIAAYPYAQDFNSGNGGWVSRTTDATRLFALDTLPYLNGPQGEGDSWYVETVTTNNGSYIWVESPVFNLSGLTNPLMSFEIKYSLHSSDYFHVEYSTNGGTTWTQLGTGATPNWYNTTNWWQNNYTTPVDQWTRVQHSLCGLIGQSCVKFRIYGRPYYSYPTYPTYYNFAFDNFEISDGPDVGVTAFIEPFDDGCLFTATQNVTVTVFNFGCGAISNVPVDCDITGALSQSLSGTVPGPIPANSSVNYTFPSTIDMTGIGTYNFAGYTIQPGDINQSNDTTNLSILVDQIVINTYPYYQDFNSGAAYWIATGSAPPTNNGRNFVLGALPYLNGPEGHGDSWYVETTSSNDGTYIWVESPVFDFTGINNPKLLMDIKYSLHSSDYFHVEYTLNGGTTWTQLGTGADPYWYNNTNWWQNNYTTPVDEWTTVEIPLCALINQPCVKFRIYGRPYYSAPTYPTYYNFSFDNFHITNTPIDAEVNFVSGCYGSAYDLDVTVFNNNRLCQTSATITSIDLTWSIDGSAPTTQTFTGLNIPFGSSQVIPISGITIPTGTSEMIVWCSLPNGLVDHIFENDTAYGYSVNWPNCNDHCSNALALGLGTTTVSQTSNASADPLEDPLMNDCFNPTLENTVYFNFTTDPLGGQVTVTFQNTICTPSTNGIQISVDSLDGPPCDTASYVNLFCSNSGNSADVVWGPVYLAPNTTYYIAIDGFAGNDCDFEIDIQGAVIPLPIELLSFTTECNDGTHLLRWVTATEAGTSGFEVQHQKPDGTFETIGYVPAAGYSASANTYVYKVNQPVQPRQMYRLKQLDINGDVSYSEVAFVECTAEGDVWIYPNPADQSSQIQFVLDGISKPELLIYDMTGKMVSNYNINGKIGLNSFEIPCAHLASGIYTYKLQGAGFSYSGKFTVQH